MKSNFDRCLEEVLRHEGGYVNDPHDPGGETNMGISKRSYPKEDIKGMTRARAAEIYRRDYWDRLHADHLPPPLALLTFDAGVNCGVSRSARWLQVAVGAKPDGEIGSRTLLAVRTRCQSNSDAVCAEMLAARLLFMSSLSTWSTFGPGWSRRLCRLLLEAARMETAP